MAERGAHLTGTVLARPSIFEIAAQKSLAATLEPATRKIITFLVSVNPEKYAWLHRWSEEVYLVFIATLQNYYLKNYSASFSETFYGLKRVAVHNSQESLDRRKLNLSLIILVLFPYLNRKIQNWEQRTVSTSREKHLKLKNYVIQAYKAGRTIKEILTLYQYLLYLSGRSKYQTVPLRLLSICLTYSEEYEEMSLIEVLKKLGGGNFSTSNGFEVLRLFVVRSIEISAFFLQFLEWWNQEHYYNFSLTALPIPPPPTIPESAKQYKGICPICRRAPRIHTALSVSGFVYCYQCILLELRSSKKCPVTGIPAKEDDLVRLYLQ